MSDTPTSDSERIGKILDMVEENNTMLKELLTHMRKMTSKEYIEEEDIKDMTSNVFANLIAEAIGPMVKQSIMDIINSARK